MDRPYPRRSPLRHSKDVRKDLESCGAEGAAKGSNSRHATSTLRLPS